MSQPHPGPTTETHHPYLPSGEDKQQDITLHYVKWQNEDRKGTACFRVHVRKANGSESITGRIC